MVNQEMEKQTLLIQEEADARLREEKLQMIETQAQLRMREMMDLK